MNTRPYTALYVHVPFCAAKCAYCAFHSEPAAATGRRLAYLARLEAEFTAQAHACAALDSVFVGGGTPSSLDPTELDALLAAVSTHFRLAPDAEITVECNPDSLPPVKIAVLAAHRVTRVSLGIQSFIVRHRRTLGRHGDVNRLERIVAELRAHGVASIGFDLIYAIPGQTRRDWSADVHRALGYGIDHLSTYALTIEEGTALAARGVEPVGDAQMVAMWARSAELAATAGLERYEVSNLARRGHACRHNDDVWHGGTLLGCGPAACSFDGLARRTNPVSLDAWLGGAPASVDVLAPEARAAEILAFGLRTVAGWQRALFRARTGFDWDTLRGPQIATLVADGLLVHDDAHVAPTDKGLLFADFIAEELL